MRERSMGNFLELTHPMINCSKVHWFLSSLGEGSQVDVDVYYGEEWHDVYQGPAKRAPNEWHVVSFGEQNVTSMRLRVYPTSEAWPFLIEAGFGQENPLSPE